MRPTVERVGVMVIRIWTEGPETELRARLTCTLDVSAGRDSSEAVAGGEQVLRAVRRFLEEFAAGECEDDATSPSR